MFRRIGVVNVVPVPNTKRHTIITYYYKHMLPSLSHFFDILTRAQNTLHSRYVRPYVSLVSYQLISEFRFFMLRY